MKETPLARRPLVSPLDAHLGYWLRFVSNHVSHAFSRRIAAHGVTVAEWVVLRALFDAGAVMPSILAERLGMTRGAITRLADRLVAKTLIVRTAGADDLRTQTLALTEAGHALVPVLSSLADANDAEFFGSIDPATHATIAAAMKAIVRRKGLRSVPVD